jgi:hypothetical protein
MLPRKAAFADVVATGHCYGVLEQGLADDALENLLDLGVPLLKKNKLIFLSFFVLS